MEKNDHALLFLGKKEDTYCTKGLNFCLANFKNVTTCLGNWGEPLSDDILKWKGDYIISYLSRWIIPESLLANARIGAINFHPAPPDYPGIGCFNFALYEGAKEYGVTCHHMKPNVDTGDIIEVKRFPILLTDDVAQLITRTYDYQLVLFYKIMSLIILGEKLPQSKEKWIRKPFTRKELDELSRITPEMDKLEILRRIKATYFGSWKPVIELYGISFELKK